MTNQLAMNAEYQAMQYQNDIIKYKMQVRDLEAKEKEQRQKMYQQSELAQKQLKEQKSDYVQQMNELKNKLRGMQHELDMERNQMSAQEEMLHSLVHNISLEFATFSSKNNQMSKKAKKKEQGFLDTKVQSVYQNN